MCDPASLEATNKGLHNAAGQGNLDMVKYLCEELEVEVNAIDQFYGQTPLHCAAGQGHLDVVKYLCEEREVNKETTANSGETPLDYALSGNKRDVAKYLSIATGVPIPGSQCACTVQ